jgi:hypothetical protein
MDGRHRTNEIVAKLHGLVVTGLLGRTVLSDAQLQALSPHFLEAILEAHQQCPTKRIRYTPALLAKHCGHRMVQVNLEYTCTVCGVKVDTPTERNLMF